MARKTDFTGDRFGDWVVTARAKPIGGKRAWIVTNTVTDDTQTVLQTELKNLANKKCPADDNCSITEDGKHEMPNSWEITDKVLSGNDPFGYVSPGTPEDDDEYPFTAVFVEPGSPFDGDAPEVDDEDEPDDLDVAKEATREMAIAFSDSLVDAIADHLASFIEEWRVIAKDELAARVQVNDLS